MMRPPPLLIMAGTHSLAKKNGTARLRFKVSSHTSGVISSQARRGLTPAAFVTIVAAPKWLAASRTTSARPLRADRSATTTAAPPARDAEPEPASLISAAASAYGADRRPTRTTLAPAWESAQAIRLPIPDPPPVQSATSPDRSNKPAITTHLRRMNFPESTWRGEYPRSAHVPPFPRAARLSLSRPRPLDWPRGSYAAS